MRYYSASGAPLTAVTPVTPAGSTASKPSVAASNGSFVIAWTGLASPTHQVIDAERFTVTSNVPTGQGIFGVNTDLNSKDGATVAMAPNGRFDIAYEREFNGPDWDIFASQYDGSGNLLHGGIAINTDPNPELTPSIAMDDAGNAVIAYEELTGTNWGAFANRLSANGAVGGVITVQSVMGTDAGGPSVALAPTTGQFAVACYDGNATIGVTEMGSNNVLVATLGPVPGFAPALSVDGLDRFLVTYHRFDAATGHQDIFSRRDLLEAVQQVSTNPQATVNDQSAVASSANGTTVVVWVDEVNGIMGSIWAQRLNKYGQPVGASIPVDVTTADSLLPHVAMDAQGRFVVAWDNDNLDGTESIMMRYYSASGAPLTPSTQVTPSGEFDYNSSVAASNGSFVISWTHETSSTNTDIEAERFTVAHNVPTGQGPFAVNADATEKDSSCVAMAPDGRFDIAFDRFNGSDWDIWASQYDGSGNLLRGDIAINSDPNDSEGPSLAMDNAGNAVVAYGERVGGNWVVNANRLGAGGTVGGIITVQAIPGGNAYSPSVALAATGGQFVVAYDVTTIGGRAVGITEVGSNDAPLATTSVFGASAPSVSIDGFGRYTVTYTLPDPSLTHWNIFTDRSFLS
jgi:hypothetical protein